MIKWIMTVVIIIKRTRDKIINKTQRAQLKMISMKVNNFNLKCLKILMNSNKRLKINLLSKIYKVQNLMIHRCLLNQVMKTNYNRKKHSHCKIRRLILKRQLKKYVRF